VVRTGKGELQCGEMRKGRVVPLVAIWAPELYAELATAPVAELATVHPVINRERRVACGKLGSPAPQERWGRRDVGVCRGMFPNWAHQRREDAGVAEMLASAGVCSQTGLTSAARTLGSR